MITELLTASSEALDRAVRLLLTGELVAFPTDTVYGVGAVSSQADAVARLFTAKLRPEKKPIALLLHPDHDLGRVTLGFPEAARRLAERYWPGGLTIILPRSPDLPDIITAGGSTIGLRVPNHPVALDLLRRIGRPLATTSANLSGSPSPKDASAVLADLSGRIPLIIDGGICPGGVESTVIDLSAPTPLIRRLGAVSQAELEETLGQMVLFAG